MVSRIDIGPDGGPYVAINENSNDLELQDINGNVIAKWDETAGQWDLNNNSLTGINAIDASSANVGSVDVGELDIGGVKYREHLQTVSSDAVSSSVTINFDSAISEGEAWVLAGRIDNASASSNRIEMSLDGIGAEQYGTVFNDGTESFQDDFWEIAGNLSSSNPQFVGQIILPAFISSVGLLANDFAPTRMDGSGIRGSPRWIDNGVMEAGQTLPDSLTIGVDDTNNVTVNLNVYLAEIRTTNL